MKKSGKIVNILCISLLSLGIACVITSIIFEIINNKDMSKLFIIIGSAVGGVALLAMIFNFVFNGVAQKPNNFSAPKPQQKEVRTVDVKDILKTHEEQLFEEYEKLYKQGLISKEDLEIKRKDLLGK